MEPKAAVPAQAGKAKDVGEKAVSDYYSYLQKNYDGMSKGNVAVSGGYLSMFFFILSALVIPVSVTEYTVLCMLPSLENGYK